MSCAETILIAKTVIEDEFMGNSQIKEWYKWLKDGGTSVDNYPDV